MSSGFLQHRTLGESSTPNLNTMEENAEDAEQISDFCRLCASKAEQLVPIFQGEGAEHELALKIKTHLPIQILETDTLPLNLCHGCASTLVQWDVMLIACVAAERKLRALQWRLQARKESWKQMHQRKVEYMKSRNSNEALSCSICSLGGMDFRQLVDHLRNHETEPSGKRKRCSSAEKTAAPNINGKRLSSPDPIPSVRPSKDGESVLLPVVRVERLNSGMMLRPRTQSSKGQNDSPRDREEATEAVIMSQELEDTDHSATSSCESNGSFIESTDIQPRKKLKRIELSVNNRVKNSATTPASQIKGTSNGVIQKPKGASSKVGRTISSPKGHIKKGNHPTLGDKEELSFPAEISNPDASATSTDTQCTPKEFPPREKPSSSRVDHTKPRVRIVSAESINQLLEKRAIMAQKMPTPPKPTILVSPVLPQGELVEQKKSKSILIPADVIKKIKSTAGPQFVQLKDGRLLRFSGVMGSKASFMSVGGCKVDPPPGKERFMSGIYAIPDKSQQGMKSSINMLKPSSQVHVNFPPIPLNLGITHQGYKDVIVLPKGNIMPKGDPVSVVPSHPSNSDPTSSSFDETQQLCTETAVIKREPEDLIPSVNENSSPPPSATKIIPNVHQNSSSHPPATKIMSGTIENSSSHPQPLVKKLVLSFQQQPGPKNSIPKYTCTFCGKRNLLKTSLSSHAEIHKPANTPQTSQFPSTSVSLQPVQVKYSQTPHSGPRTLPSSKLSYKFTCQNCGKEFGSQLEVSTHVKLFCKATVK